LTALVSAALACSLAAGVPAALRWLRVAQREHYLPGAVSRFALRWWRSRAANLAAGLVGALAAMASTVEPGAALAAALVAAAAPIGLTVRGRTSKLSWTRRLRTLAGALAVLFATAIAIGAAVGGLAGATAAAALAVIALPVLGDAALALLAPLEARLAARFVSDAARRVASIRPRVVAITGSYGKTSTKGYVAHLLAAHYAVVASPRSFNNRAGLARTVNEHLLPGSEVLVAEMGTFGPGEIAELCDWLPPEVAVITAVGPVHLERFGSIEAILKAKSEITERAAVCVLNVDDERLAGLAARLEAAERPVVRCSGGGAAAEVTVTVDGDALTLLASGRTVGSVIRPAGAAPVVASNVACAVAAAMAIGLPEEDALRRLADLPGAANRLAVERAASGVVVLDDTYNANPAGGRFALEALARAGGGRRVVVTPGMVELGTRQDPENASFAAHALDVADVLLVVGRTNRKALLHGANGQAGGRRVVCVERREEAVDWVRRELRAGDVVLYENDLPDHFP
jgi:UDP-N-acetylmuramoyl-tripeptide--D-alanyl-D-alanine ligase